MVHEYKLTYGVGEERAEGRAERLTFQTTTEEEHVIMSSVLVGDQEEVVRFNF